MGRAFLGIVVFAAAGCASVRAPRYYTWDLRPAGAARPSCNIVVQRLRVADPLTRRNILIKRSPIEVEYYALDEWVSGLEQLATHKLQTEFGDELPGRKTVLLEGTLRAFEQQDLPAGARAYAQLSVIVCESPVTRSSTPLLEKTYEAAVDMPDARPVNLAEALSRAIERIAAQITSDLAALE